MSKAIAIPLPKVRRKKRRPPSPFEILCMLALVSFAYGLVDDVLDIIAGQMDMSSPWSTIDLLLTVIFGVMAQKIWWPVVKAWLDSEDR
jgi:hypothetical protein